jgi:hypothetical integral membrane protein (TIGR02206 family)
MPAYSVTHILWLGGIAAGAVLMAMASRREWIPRPLIRYALAIFMIGVELERYSEDGFIFPNRLPFNLCNVAAWAAALACLTLWPMACEFAYFWGIVGAGMALVQPDMGSVWPVRFFTAHGAIIVIAITLAFGDLMPILRGAVGRAYGLFLAYIAIMGWYDWQFGSNFAFLARKPSGTTLVTFLGPWPFYLAVEGLLGLALLWLLWLPLRKRAEPESLLATQNFHGFSPEQTMGGQPSGAGGK